MLKLLCVISNINELKSIVLNVKASRSAEFMLKVKSLLYYDILFCPNKYETDDKIISSYFKEKYEKFNEKNSKTMFARLYVALKNYLF